MILRYREKIEEMDDINTELILLFVKRYGEGKKNNIFHVPGGSVCNRVIRQAYKEFIADGYIKPLEQLTLEEKRLLLDECRAGGETFTNETLIQRCMNLHVIKFIQSTT